MFTVRHIVGTLGCLSVSVSLCLAQNIAPSHSGTVDYFQGDVSIDGLQLVSKTARFNTLKEQGVLKTGEGRAELLLTPGVFLRVAENSSVRMLDSDLMHTRVQLVSGSAMVEAMESGTDVKDPPVTIIYNDFQSQPVKYGIYEISAAPAQLRVFEGEARVSAGNSDQWTKVKDGHQVALTTELASTKFDDKIADDLYLWSRDRSGYLAAGNLSSARALAATGRGFGGYSSMGWNAAMWNGFSGGWYYNSFLNMYSYMPFGASVMSPFGYGIYNPVTIGYVYVPGYYWSGAGGARTGTTSGVPLTGVSRNALMGSRSGSNAPQLPRLGTTATLRPTVNAPLRGAEIGSPRTSFGREGLAGDRSAPPSFNNNINNNVGMRSAPAMSAPAMSAPAMSAPAPAPVSAPSAGASRAGAMRR
jgi:hypothetical protein